MQQPYNPLTHSGRVSTRAQPLVLTRQHGGPFHVTESRDLTHEESRELEEQAQALHGRILDTAAEQLTTMPQGRALAEVRRLTDRALRAMSSYEESRRAIEGDADPDGMAERMQRLPALTASIAALARQIQHGQEQERVLASQFLGAAAVVVCKTRMAHQPECRAVVEDRARPLAERLVAARLLQLLESTEADQSLPRRVLHQMCPHRPGPVLAPTEAPEWFPGRPPTDLTPARLSPAPAAVVTPAGGCPVRVESVPGYPAPPARPAPARGATALTMPPPPPPAAAERPGGDYSAWAAREAAAAVPGAPGPSQRSGEAPGPDDAIPGGAA